MTKTLSFLHTTTSGSKCSMLPISAGIRSNCHGVLRKPMPIYVEKTILELERIYINGGRRGFLVAIDPKELVRVAKATAVDVALEK